VPTKPDKCVSGAYLLYYFDMYTATFGIGRSLGLNAGLKPVEQKFASTVKKKTKKLMHLTRDSNPKPPD